MYPNTKSFLGIKYKIPVIMQWRVFISTIAIIAGSSIYLSTQSEIFCLTEEDVGENDFIRMTTDRPWYFRKGHNPEWKSGEIILAEWEKRTPYQFEKKMLEDGRLEGRFRMQSRNSEGEKVP